MSCYAEPSSYPFVSLRKLPTERNAPAARNASDKSAESPQPVANFLDVRYAMDALARLKAMLSPELATSLPGLISEAPDPDAALILFERLVNESSPEVVRLIERHRFLAHYAILIFGYSRFLGETLIQNTDLLNSLVRENTLDRSFSREDFHEALARFRSRSFETDLALLLARFKKREYIRIVLRDVLKIGTLAETTAEISALADVLIGEALREAESDLQGRYGFPQHLDGEDRVVPTPFSVLSFGKLGGNELNYSSDVDLMYVFGDGNEPPGSPICNREYFVRLAQRTTEILSRVTREGAVFRIDMRLRPQGNEGELAISLAHALRYYTSSAEDWECQALIKVRYTAGDPTLAREFIRGVQGHVYVDEVAELSEDRATQGPLSPSGLPYESPSSVPATRLNFAAIETALESRQKMLPGMRDRAHPDGRRIDVKMDRGGIRDIEFLVQCLQRVYGGRERWLRSGGSLFSLQKLHDKGHLTSKEFHDLTEAYEFLRHLEHRLQLREGQQTHRLPESEVELDILRRSMATLVPEGIKAGDFVEFVRLKMAAVLEIYQRIIHHQQAQRLQEAPAVEFRLSSGDERGSLEQTNQQILRRLAVDSPLLREIAGREELSSPARKNLFRFLSATFTSSERYSTLLRYAATVEQALGLFDMSEFLAEILVRHPEEIATLDGIEEVNARIGSGYLFDSPLGRADAVGDPVFAYLANSSTSYGERLSLLRQHYRHRVFASSARDLKEFRQVYESMGTNSAAAEDAIAAAFGIVGQPSGLAVMALGRLGSGEFDVLSDADLLFVGDKDIDRKQLMRNAERLVHALAAYTRDGMVLPVDTRLRPRGDQGDLVVTVQQLENYFAQEALPWEALTFTKLRFLTGDRMVGAEAVAATSRLFERFAGDTTFPDRVREMRVRQQAAGGAEKNFKSAAGGIYDIDFLSSYLLVRHRVPDKLGTLRDRLWRLSAAGLLGKSDAAALDHAAELMRTAEHAVRLALGRARKWLPATEHARESTERLTAGILRREFSHGLEQELVQTMELVRSIFDRVMN